VPHLPFSWILQGWWLHHLPGQSVPMPHCSFGEEIFPNIQLEPPLVQFKDVTSCLITRCVFSPRVRIWAIPKAPCVFTWQKALVTRRPKQGQAWSGTTAKAQMSWRFLFFSKAEALGMALDCAPSHGAVMLLAGRSGISTGRTSTGLERQNFFVSCSSVQTLHCPSN